MRYTGTWINLRPFTEQQQHYLNDTVCWEEAVSWMCCCMFEAAALQSHCSAGSHWSQSRQQRSNVTVACLGTVWRNVLQHGTNEVHRCIISAGGNGHGMKKCAEHVLNVPRLLVYLFVLAGCHKQMNIWGTLLSYTRSARHAVSWPGIPFSLSQAKRS